MKIALICDTHVGVRNDNVAFHEYLNISFDNFFFPSLRENGIKHIVHLGDVVDRRKYINFITAHRLRKDFLEPVNNEFTMDIIAGNHDIYYKNKYEINALHELIDGRYSNINVYHEATELLYDGLGVLLVPWICDQNHENTLNAIKNTSSQVCFGHLELQGYEMHRGNVADHGFSPALFGKFDIVCSGHYHHKSSSSNVNYLGAFAEFTWADYDDPRGYHIFDTETRELTFIQNPYKMFAKLRYDDEGKFVDDVLNIKENVSRQMVKVVVANKTNPYWFDMFIDKLEAMGPIDIQPVEDFSVGDTEDVAVDETEDTVTIFKKYISQLSLESTRQKSLEKLVINLYNEALSAA